MLLDIVEVTKLHTGENLAAAFAKIMDDFKIDKVITAVTIFTFHRTFPHSCFYLPLVAGQSLYISSYLSITTYCLLRHSNAQRLLVHSLLTYAQHAYLRTAFLYSI